jgi:hypothetical protein
MIETRYQIGAARPTSRRGLASLVLVAAAALVPAHRCTAGLVLSVQNVRASAGSSGSFDMIITNNTATGGASYLVASDVVKVGLTGTTGVQFSGVSISTAMPYIFPVSGTTQGGGPLSTSTFPGTSFTASDSDFETTAPYARMISAGQTYGLAHILYSVAAGAVGSAGSISIDPALSGLSDPNFTAVAFTVTNGSFTVTGAAVPEPSTMLMTAAGAVLASIGRRLPRTKRLARGRPEERDEAC